MCTKFLLFACIIFMMQMIEINCHARLLVPPARSSAWREDPSRFPAYYDDNSMFCGGFYTQWGQNKNHKGGRCGICGENYNGPKLFEKGGPLYRGYTVRTYRENEQITAVVEVTANHMGYFEFRICNVDKMSSGEANQECLNENVLRDRFGRVRIPVVPGVTGRIPVVLTLPKGLSCNHCVLQWKYNAGNSWNTDPVTKQGCMGCGPQEQFYGCSDVRIMRGNGFRLYKKENYEIEKKESVEEKTTSISKSMLKYLLSEIKRLKKNENKEVESNQNEYNLRDEEMSLTEENQVESPFEDRQELNEEKKAIIDYNEPGKPSEQHGNPEPKAIIDYNEPGKPSEQHSHNDPTLRSEQSVDKLMETIRNFLSIKK